MLSRKHARGHDRLSEQLHAAVGKWTLTEQDVLTRARLNIVGRNAMIHEIMWI
jgi:hypothetical protein